MATTDKRQEDSRADDPNSRGVSLNRFAGRPEDQVGPVKALLRAPPAARRARMAVRRSAERIASDVTACSRHRSTPALLRVLEARITLAPPRLGPKGRVSSASNPCCRFCLEGTARSGVRCVGRHHAMQSSD
jgi:hypothetical protein